MANPVPQVSLDVTDTLNVRNNIRGHEIGGTFRPNLEPVESGQYIDAQPIDRCKDAGDPLMLFVPVSLATPWPMSRRSDPATRSTEQIANYQSKRQLHRWPPPPSVFRRRDRLGALDRAGRGVH